MANNVSPGVYTKIVDLSTYLQDVPGTIGFVPFFSRRGPDNQLKFISSLSQFVDTYGKPNINDFGRAYGQGAYVAFNHISVSPSFYCLRVLPDDAAYSNVLLSFIDDSTGAITVTHVENQNSLAEIQTTVETNDELTSTYPLAMFYGVGRGDAYNDFAVSISRHANTYLNSSIGGVEATAAEAVYIVDVFETQSDGGDVKIESFLVCFDPNAVDDVGDSLFVEDVINRFSKYIRVAVNLSGVYAWIENGNTEISIPVEGTSIPVHLDHGSEGSLVDIGVGARRTIDVTEAISSLSSAYSGTLLNPITNELEDSVLDTDDIYIPIVYDAGYPSAVKQTIVNLVSTVRLDGVAIIDNGDNISVDESLIARNNEHNYNTYFVAIYEPYTKVYDIHTGKDVWFSPVYHMSTMIPLNDKLYDIWFPSAGFNRGTISNIKDMRFSPKLAQRDQLYLQQVNPIVKFSIGETIWGNLTSQRRPSSMQNLSTVRTILYIKRALEQFLRFYVFELNDPVTWENMQSAIAPFLETVKNARGITSYSIDIGASEYEIKTKKVHVNISIVPTGIIEKIELNLFIK